MSLESNKTIVSRYSEEVWNRGNLGRLRITSPPIISVTIPVFLCRYVGQVESCN